MTSNALRRGCLALSFLASVLPIELLAVDISCVTPPSEMAAWWRAEGNGNDSAGTNQALLLNGVNFTNGMVGQAFVLDGIDDGLSVASLPPLNFGPGQDLSIEGWIRAFPRVTDLGIMSIVDKRFAPNLNQGQGYEFNLDHGQLHCRLSDSTNDVGSGYGPAGPNLQDGQFHHVAMTVHRTSTNGGHLYVDGQSVLVFDPTTQPGSLSTAEPLRIGYHATPSLSTFFNGLIDELSIYRRALTDSEILAIYNAGAAGKCAGPGPTNGPPQITSFSPKSGLPGTMVTISGVHFSPTAGSNIVYFGAVKAFVSSATANQLQVIVPVGATCAPITETVNGLTAYANAPFIVTYSGPGQLNTNSLGPRIDLPTGSGPFRTVLADLDRDGWPDLITANVFDASIWIFHNQHLSPLSGASFAPAVVLNVGGGSDSLYGLAVGDFDGDGRLDIAVGNRASNNVSIFRNNAPEGFLPTNSFAARIDLPVSTSPLDIAVVDLDRDGRPDIATANYGGNTISILRNTSTGGNISFAPRFDLTGNAGTHGLVLADLDGDGRAELVVANGSGDSDTLSVFRNISSAGTLGPDSFGPRIDFAGGGEYPIVADFNGDGFLDVAVGSWQKQVVSIFRNKATGFLFSTNSLDTRSDIAAGGNVHHLAIGDLDGDGKPDLGAVTELPSQLSLFQNVSTQGAASITFGPRLQFATGWNAAGLSIGDLDGDTRPDIAFGNSYDSMISLYRNISPFTPPASNCVAVPVGLVSWWGGQGNALDSQGTNNGVLAGNVTYTAGKVGPAFALDGSADAIVVGNPANLQLQNFTIETWMRRADPFIVSHGTHQDALLFGYGSGGYGLGLHDDGRLFLTRVDIDNVTITNGISDTNFHHVAVTKTNTTVVFYIDGVRYPGGPYETTYTFDTAAAIGARADTMDDSFLGIIDEMSIYNRVLSLDEIRAIYNAGALGKCRPPTPLAIVAQPHGDTVYSGENVTLTVNAVSSNPITYQWRRDGDSLLGQTAAMLSLPNIQTNQAGNYSVLVSDGVDTLVSSNAAVIVLARPPCVPTVAGLVSWWQADGNAFDSADNNQGTLVDNATFGPGFVGQAFQLDGALDAVRVGNPANLQLQDFTIETWIKRGDPAIATRGTHGTALFFGYGSAGYGFGMFDDGRLFLTRVDIDNVNVSTSLTDTNHFHHVAVTKLGTNVMFYLDGVAFPADAYGNTFTFSSQAAIGARGDTLNDGFLGLIDDLAIYNRQLSSGEIGAIYAAGPGGKCKVPRPPVIVQQPASRTNYLGDTVTFTVIASGDMPLMYQWRFEGTNLPGRTSTSLVLTNVKTNNAGRYSVLVSNAVDSVVSADASLTLVPRPPCTPAPQGLVSWWRAESNVLDAWDSNDGLSTEVQLYATGKVGTAFSIPSFGRALAVSDSPSLRLTNSLSIEAWVNPTIRSSLPQTILAKFKLPEPANQLQSSYFLGLTNTGAPVFILSPSGSMTNARILVASQIVPTNQWSFVVATYDGSAMRLYVNGQLSAETNYSAGIFSGPVNVGIGSLAPTTVFPVPFQTTWAFTGLIDELSLYNRALTGDEIRAVYQADVTGKCLVPPVIAVQLQSQAIPLGEDVLFAPKVTGTRPFRYQWRFNGINLFGATNSTLLLEKVQSNRVGNYSVLVTNSVGSALSSNALLTLLPAPVCVPAPPGAISWWPADNNSLDAAGTNNAITSFVPAYAVTGKVAQAFNSSIQIRDLSPGIYAPNSPSLNFGSNANFSIEGWIKAWPTNISGPFSTIVDKRTLTPGNGVGYSLLLNQGRLAFWLASAPASATNASMFVSPGPDLRDGMFHHVAVSLNRSAANGGVLFVDGQPVLTFDPTARRGDLSNSSTFLIGTPVGKTALSSSNTVFFGLIDELALYGRALDAAEVLSIRQAGAAGKCKVKPFIITQPVGQRVNAGSNVTLSVEAGGNSPLRYQWLRNTIAVPGATAASLTFQAQVSLAGSYSVRVSNAFGQVTSSNAVVIVNTAPTALNASVTVNEDTPAAITLHGLDPQNDLLTFAVLSGPTHGTLTGAAPILTYTPAHDYNGSDQFTFKVNDGLLDSGAGTISITVSPVNDPPQAAIQVGPLFALTPDETNLLVLSLNNTNAAVVLDGSGSTDVENDPLSFAWFEGTNFLGSGMLLTNLFSIDSHTVTLAVNDGQDTGSASVTFEVVSAGASVREIYGMLQVSGLPPQVARPLQSSLKAASSAFDSGNVTAAINVLQSFQNKVRAQVQPSDPVLAAELIEAAQRIIDTLTASP